MRPFLHRRLAQLVIAVLTFLAYSASITRKEKIRVHSQQITKPLILFSPTSGLGNSIFGLLMSVNSSISHHRLTSSSWSERVKIR